MKIILVTFVVGTFVMMSSGIYGVAANLKYRTDVKAHLEAVAHSSYIEHAKKELKIALDEIETQGLNKGSTHLFWKTSQTDLSFWYGELLELQKKIDEIPTDTSYTVQAAELKAVQSGSSIISAGTSQIVEPPMIDVYPHQWTLVVWNISAIVCGVTLTVLIIRLFIYLNPN